MAAGPPHNNNGEKSMTTRRDVMMGGAALAAASAMPAFGGRWPQSPLGVAQTALGHYFRKQRGDNPNARGPADPFATVDYVRSLGAGGVQMALPLDTDIKKLRARLDHHKMFFEGDIRLLDKPGDDTAAFEKGLRMYKELGAPWCARSALSAAAMRISPPCSNTRTGRPTRWRCWMSACPSPTRSAFRWRWKTTRTGWWMKRSKC